MSMLALALGVLAFPACAQDIKPDTVTGTKGACELLVVNGQPLNCQGVIGVMYVHMTNGGGIFAVGTGPKQVMGFSGERNSQSVAGEYRLYLSMVRVAAGDEVRSSGASGVCKVQMSRDGKIWYRVDCDAIDEMKSQYKLHFRSNGDPIEVEHLR